MWRKSRHFTFSHCFIFVVTLVFGSNGLPAVDHTTAPYRPICVYYLSSEVQSPSDDGTFGDELLGNGTVMCHDSEDYCFSFYEVVPFSQNTPANESSSEGTTQSPSDITNVFGLEGSIKWLARGCFKNTHLCDTGPCHATRRGTTGRTRFCCCKGSFCNLESNIIEATHSPIIAQTDTSATGDLTFSFTQILSILMGIISSFVFLCVVVYILRRTRNKKKSSTPTPREKNPLESSNIDLGSLEFQEEIGDGRFGKVYKAMLKEEVVAVKLLSPSHRNIFNDESYIYSLPGMEHPNLLTYFGGGDVQGPGNVPCLGIVLSLCPKGKLCNYLSENTLDFATFCHIVITANRGLGHLHSFDRGANSKPCVAHRDFNTRNILLKEDLTCVVSDLGFAIHTSGAKFFVNGEERNAEMASLSDVGTLRYMAPEVLEGAVNLRDCETSLKQIDIYALGLVLWEIASRCHELYQGMDTPAYSLPFQKEIGTGPSFEQMQVLVARNKARPLFPDVWKDTNLAIRQLKETIEDCWDNDAEARLSAQCVEKRLLELKNLWHRHKSSLPASSVSPTSNPGNAVLNQVRSTDEGNNSCIISNQLSLPNDKGKNPPSRPQMDASVSESTVETTVPSSPSEQNVSSVLAKNQCAVNVPVTRLTSLQPHQGRNPCMERNTIHDTRNEPTVSGNIWLETSDHLSNGIDIAGLNNSKLIKVLERHHGLDPHLWKNEHLVPLLNGFLPASQQAELLQEAPPPVLPFGHFSPAVLPPIPYVQNAVRGMDNCPKQENVNRESERKKAISQNRWTNFRKLLGKIV